MSYIDTIDHELVGLFAGLPVYHPLETLHGDPTTPADFSCTPDQLVIGGGGGEHPGCVLLRPASAVALFTRAWLIAIEDKQETLETDLPETAITSWEEFIDIKLMNTDEVILFAGWGVRDYHDFYGRCTSNVLWRPYIADDGPLEEWLVASLGEFVFFSMPELVPSLDENLPRARYYIRRPLYLNILVPPRGYDPPLGRKTMDNKAIWGNVRH